MRLMKMMNSNLAKLYYTIWYFLLDRKILARHLLELIIVVLILIAVRPLLAVVCRVVCFLVQNIIIAIMKSSQFLLNIVGLRASSPNRVVHCEDRVITAGKKAYEKVETIKVKIKKREILHIGSKWIFVFGIIVYLFSILPVFQLEKYLNEYYVKPLYGVYNVWCKAEKKMTKGIEEYPYPFKVVKEEETDDKEEESEEGFSVYLVGEGKSGANLRNSPEKTKGNVICVVDSEDKFWYTGENSWDGKRLWLMVQVNDGEVSGWISARILSKEKNGKTMDKLLEK